MKLLLLFLFLSVSLTSFVQTEVDIYKREVLEDELKKEYENAEKAYQTCYNDIYSFIESKQILRNGITYLKIDSCFTQNTTILDNILLNLTFRGWNIGKKRISIYTKVNYRHFPTKGRHCSWSHFTSDACQSCNESLLMKEEIYDKSANIHRINYQWKIDAMKSVESFLCNIQESFESLFQDACPCHIWTVMFDTR